MRRLGLPGLWLWLSLARAAGQAPEVPVRLGELRHFEDVRPDRVFFRHLTIEEGLSQNAVYALLQDRQGFLWIGTTGGGACCLARATVGTPEAAFVRFAHAPGDPRSLSDDRVMAVLADRRGAVWIGTEAGLNRLDPPGDPGQAATGHGFGRYYPRPGEPGSLSDAHVTALAEARDGTLWVGSSLGLDRLLDPERGRSAAYPYPAQTQRRSYDGGTIRQLGEDLTGRLRLATVTHLYTSMR